MSHNESSAREQAEKISSGESEPHHIGKKTNKVLIQEYFSLINVKRMFRNKKWQNKWNEVTTDLRKLPASERSSIIESALKMKNKGRS